ncbi:MAG: hypothetical protein Q4D05_03265 [Acinetobacter sp.]|nr:hypothetical protein [Acinetobacter sp.]
MIIDFPPHEMAIIKQASEKQGLDVESYAQKVLFENAINTLYEFKGYDIEAMDKALNGGFVEVPHFSNDDDFIEWLNNLTDDDFTKGA